MCGASAYFINNYTEGKRLCIWKKTACVVYEKIVGDSRLERLTSRTPCVRSTN